VIDKTPEHIDLVPHIYQSIHKTAKMMIGLILPFFGIKYINFIVKKIRNLSPENTKHNKIFLAHFVRMQEEIGQEAQVLRLCTLVFLMKRQN